MSEILKNNPKTTLQIDNAAVPAMSWVYFLFAAAKRKYTARRLCLTTGNANIVWSLNQRILWFRSTSSAGNKMLSALKMSS